NIVSRRLSHPFCVLKVIAGPPEGGAAVFYGARRAGVYAGHTVHAASEPARPPVLDGDVAHGAEPCALAAAYAGPRGAEGAVLYEQRPKNAVHRPALEAVERPGVRVAEGPP